MPGALEPIEDVCASRVVDLVEGVCVRFLDSHGVAENQTGDGSDGQHLGGLAEIQDGVSIPRRVTPTAKCPGAPTTPHPSIFLLPGYPQ